MNFPDSYEEYIKLKLKNSSDDFIATLLAMHSEVDIDEWIGKNYDWLIDKEIMIDFKFNVDNQNITYSILDNEWFTRPSEWPLYPNMHKLLKSKGLI